MASKPRPFKVARDRDGTRFTALRSLVASEIPLQRAQLLEALQDLTGPVILDLSKAEMVDSLGLTLIVRLFKSCEAKALPFAVEGANPEVMRLFSFFTLSDLFPVKER